MEKQQSPQPKEHVKVQDQIMSKRFDDKMKDVEQDFYEKLFGVDWDKADPDDRQRIFKVYNHIYQKEMDKFANKHHVIITQPSSFEANNCDNLIDITDFWTKFWQKVSFLFTGYPIRPYGV